MVFLISVIYGVFYGTKQLAYLPFADICTVPYSPGDEREKTLQLSFGAISKTLEDGKETCRKIWIEQYDKEAPNTIGFTIQPISHAVTTL